MLGLQQWTGRSGRSGFELQADLENLGHILIRQLRQGKAARRAHQIAFVNQQQQSLTGGHTRDAEFGRDGRVDDPFAILDLAALDAFQDCLINVRAARGGVYRNNFIRCTHALHL